MYYYKYKKFPRDLFTEKWEEDGVIILTNRNGEFFKFTEDGSPVGCPCCPETWEPPDWCLEPPDPPGCNDDFTRPQINIDTKVDCEDKEVSLSTICRIGKSSTTLLPNSIVLNAYLGVDSSITDSLTEGFNINRVFIAKDESSSNYRIINNSNVTVAPKQETDDFELLVSDDIWDLLSDRCFSSFSLYSWSGQWFFLQPILKT